MGNLPRLPALALAAFLAILASEVRAEDVRTQPTPFSVWLPFQGQSRLKSLPIWLESLRRDTQPAWQGTEKTVFRLRLRRFTQLHSAIQLRLFFEDQPDARPVVSGWSETGVRQFLSGPLGTGIGLPTSESIELSTASLDYIEIEVPGNGAHLRGAFLASLQKSELQHPIDFKPAAASLDAFGNLPASRPAAADAFLFGRVKATIDPGTVKLEPGPGASATWELSLARAALLGVASFEVLNADPSYPLEIVVNDQPLGAVSVHLPDLADPGYLGTVRPLEAGMRFRYSGWVRAHAVIPGAALRTGLNKVDLWLHKDSGPVAIRAWELQLKYPGQNSDYSLEP
ncbi:MAG: hypothetical protein M3463_11660 [Verrucomicrobiota bacterium]|nr:hypothetical protein [Verrucomicrobiota bacterium]